MGSGSVPRDVDKKGILAPNIAIYCKTPVRDGDLPEVHIINVIGCALDAAGPDFQYFLEDPKKMVSRLKVFYRGVFLKVFECAKRLSLPIVCMSLVGALNFAKLYPGGKNAFKKDVWIPEFRKVIRGYPNIEIVFMGSGDFAEEFVDVGYFPDLLAHINPKKTLLVNAWDPFSFVGNGNNKDNSLDGFIGRNTACAMLCWPLVNSHMKFVPLKLA